MLGSVALVFAMATGTCVDSVLAQTADAPVAPAETKPAAPVEVRPAESPAKINFEPANPWDAPRALAHRPVLLPVRVLHVALPLRLGPSAVLSLRL